MAKKPTTSADTKDAQPVAVVNRTFAERFWPGDDAVGNAAGRQIHLGPPEWPWRTVVGVADDLRYRHLTDRRPDLLLPATQSPWQPSHLSLRAAGSLSPAGVEALIPAVRTEIGRAAPRTWPGCCITDCFWPNWGSVVVCCSPSLCRVGSTDCSWRSGSRTPWKRN